MLVNQDNERILEILKLFEDFLTIGHFWNYSLRWIGWFLIQGLSLLVDGIESVTDTMLGIKTFFASEGIQDFISTIQPYLYILLAFSFLYVGYMLIMNKKINREQIAMNVFISIAVLFLLSPGMVKVDKFTDASIEAVALNGEGTISQKIIKDNLTDIALYAENNFSSTELKPTNNIHESDIMLIDITEKIDKDFKLAGDKEMSAEAKKVISNKAKVDNAGNKQLVELKNGWFDFFPEQYYRWAWNYWTIFVTLCAMGFTLFLVSFKIAKLSFELAFNYILAILIAPADVSNGQKLKEVIKSILNTFAVIIMIFVSLKVYMLGIAYIGDKLVGIPYLIALIAFSVVVVNGPTMVERVFGMGGGMNNEAGLIQNGVQNGVRTFDRLRNEVDRIKSARQGKNLQSANNNVGMPKNDPSKNDNLNEQQKKDNPLTDQGERNKDNNGKDKNDNPTLEQQRQMEQSGREEKENQNNDPQTLNTLEDEMKQSDFKPHPLSSKYDQTAEEKTGQGESSSQDNTLGSVKGETNENSIVTPLNKDGTAQDTNTAGGKGGTLGTSSTVHEEMQGSRPAPTVAGGSASTVHEEIQPSRPAPTVVSGSTSTVVENRSEGSSVQTQQEIVRPEVHQAQSQVAATSETIVGSNTSNVRTPKRTYKINRSTNFNDNRNRRPPTRN
ncbi:pLS20_p028 family conjugation system transmembrane protein [Metabacillus fastidiosus]|uniref:pLS20_p028 family conjugation system transmembrane protein n=1 Tax=Metabacillus fastidiosus TaxID=1458 RepID=UPI003D2A1832